LKKEWEENDFGMRPGFDREAHLGKREAAQVKYQREFWFDITEVFESAAAIIGEKLQSKR